MARRTLIIALLVAIGLACPLSAQDREVSYDPSWTVRELAAAEKVPVKELADRFGLTLDEIEGAGLSSLGITPKDVDEALSGYREGEMGIVGSIVVVGMLIVFVSLVVVAFLISLFRHLSFFDSDGPKKRSKSVESPVGTITSSGDLSEQSIAAVIAAVFLHEAEVDSENRLLLTWKRASSRVWRPGDAMPNASYFAAKRGRT